MSFLDMTPKARVRKAKTSKRDYIKIKSFYTEKETMVMGVHQPYYSDHFIIYTHTESLWCISETNSAVCQLYLKNIETTIWKSSTYDHWFSLSWRFSSAQFSHSVVSKSATPWVHHQLSDPPKPTSIESVMPSNHLILCRPLLLPSIFPSIRVFSNESALPIRWPKYWSFSFNISPSNEHPGLISFRMDWLGLLAVQGTLKSLQHHSSKASILRHSAFFIVQFLHPYMTTGKTIALTRWTFVDKVMSLLFNMLSRLLITFKE